MSNAGQQKLHRAVVVQTAFLGDLVLTTPLFRALKQIDPDCYLTAVIRPEYREILKGVPDIDEFVFYDKAGRDRGGLGFLRKIRELKVRSLHLAVSPHRSTRTAIMLWRARIPRRVGFSRASASFLYTERIHRDEAIHEVDRNLSLVQALGWSPAAFERVPHLGIREGWREEARRLLPDSSEYVGIAPSSVWPTKRWIPSGFSRLAELLESRKLKTVFLGEPGARVLAEEIISQTRAAPVNLVGRTSLGALTAVVDRLRLVVSNDSALVHIASARNVPSVVIFGPTAPEFGFGPLTPGSATIGLPLECRPCSRHGPKRCPQGHFRCMRELPPEQVFQAVMTVLDSEQSLSPGVGRREGP